MAEKQRLTLASMWAFEDIGVGYPESNPGLDYLVRPHADSKPVIQVHEIQSEFKKASPERDCLCEYSKTYDLLVMKGGFKGSSSKFASVLSDFVEEQKNKDLLDMPRIRQLDIPSMFNDEDDQTNIDLEKDRKQDLLTLVDDSNEELIPISLNRITKAWLASNGGLGCFASNFHEVLADIAAMTGTEISVVDETKGIQVSGQNQGDVEDALGKLTRIEKPLTFIGNPRVSNTIIAPDNERTRVRIQNYSDLNPVALRRILTDPNAYSNATLNQTFVTTLLSFNSDLHLFSLSENLVTPPKATNEPGKSRIWNDFIFQEIGKGDDFVTEETIIEKDSANPQTMASGIAPPHPFLSVEKATRVNQWVVERAEMDNDEPEPVPEPEPSVQPQPDIPRELPPPLAPSIKKPPGIRTRKAISTAKPQAPSIPGPTPEPEPVKLSPGEKKGIPTRKRWIMQYESGPEDRQISLLEDANNRSTMVKTPDSPPGSSTTARPETPEDEPRLSINFDPTKYGLNKSPQHAAKSSFGSSTSPANGEDLLMTPKRRPTKPSDLIDLGAPATPGNTAPHPLMSFDQPALIPQKFDENDSPTAENIPPRELALLNTGKSSHDLLGLEFEREATSAVSESSTDAGPGSALIPLDQNEDNLSWQEKRLRDLKKSLREKKKEITSLDENTPTFHRPPKDQRQISMLLARQRLAELEKNLETVKESSDEASTREFHRTMNHKTARPSEKVKSKAEANAKRQATLEDAWRIPSKSAKKPVDLPNKSEIVDDNAKDKAAASEARKPARQAHLQKIETEAHWKTVKNVFEALKPALDAAEYFTGPLTLEVQLGLILIPLLPKTYDEGLLSLEEWTKIFQPRNGLPAPTTKFINRLTTTGSDADHIVDLKTSKAEGKQHIFEQEYTEYNVSYEFHCRTTADQPFIIAIDEQGKHSIRKPATTLGAVNLHFPRQSWDASVVLGGIIEHIVGSDSELEEAVQHLVDNLWVQPDKSLIRIFSRLPRGNKFIIEKVFMKRWTRHRHILPDIISAASAGAGRAVPENATSPSPTPTPSATDPEPTDNQDIFLQITEVQDLLIGSSTSDSQALRARCAPLPEMHKKDRLWYEVSLVSPAIEAILKANANVEIGERTDDWRSMDVLGQDAALVSDDINVGVVNGNANANANGVGNGNGNGNGSMAMALSSPLSPVAMAIGTAGLGELLRLSKTVVEKIDGIGFFNYGPGVEAVRVATAGTVIPGGATATAIDTGIANPGPGAAAGPGTATAAATANPLAMSVTSGKPPPPPTSSSALVLKTDQLYQQQSHQARLLGLDDLDNSKEVDSVMKIGGVGVNAGTAVGTSGPLMERSSSASSARIGQGQGQLDELDYW